jgi:hypothetical protein
MQVYWAANVKLIRAKVFAEYSVAILGRLTGLASYYFLSSCAFGRLKSVDLGPGFFYKGIYLIQ